MAIRQSVLRSPPPRPELEQLLNKARELGVTDAQLQQQRVSFAYGNAPLHDARVTKESAIKASTKSRLVGAA